MVAVRSFGRGLDADGNGVVVRNMLRTRPIPWRELAAIEFKGVDSEAIPLMLNETPKGGRSGGAPAPREVS